MKKRNSCGFTLLELIIAIVILGILAVVAAPRFLNLQDDAYEAKMEAIADQFETAVKFTQSQWLVNGGTPAAQQNIDGYGGGELDVNEFGYPLGTNKGNASGNIGNPYNIGQGNAGCIAVWQALLGDEYSLSNNRNANDRFDFITRRIRDNDSHQSVCYYTYTKKGYERTPENSSFVIWYDSKAGTVTTSKPSRLP
ncbi:MULTISPECIES: type II secretion system protein [Vibrio]|jgi:prepilin-type N-terminal cleavage/methylation domain-containing protein|uniref:Prepilin-type cleavage/methylation domain-containing protein n=1 Tax=Vibrio jasicida TaxID=766224 RepID=A0AAU9QQI7_9VIBR|nr:MULTISPECIES: type II secretion system protein [Vibrio]KIP78851.1 N-terminal cleavage protein [Vibrio harveyi]MCF6451936.1 type II secretion system GspH family protein [Vibrio sp. MMG023]MCX2791177.1 type II secretion system protein [Vibrio sp. Sgm 5]CAH1592186.1 Prepilin-type cleavage/methylation domain-containing protein [Vibrio jasicida]CAH1597180.1 Prepilin-type cleavage/methylation domain-containing protein [Vibrio jasicida]